MSILAFSCLAALASCHSGKQEAKLKFHEGTLTTCFSAKPDPSTDVQTLQEAYTRHPERWETAFEFLCGNDLSTYPLGRVDLSDDVYASVSESETKDPDEPLYEAHKKYVDIQYIVTGKERMELYRGQDLTVHKPYNPESDVMFFEHKPGTMLEATPERFFIFFPTDIHRPSIAAGEKSKVRKVVVKISCQ
jgi:YhcH/YjgK/YiaL family protein